VSIFVGLLFVSIIFAPRIMVARGQVPLHVFVSYPDRQPAILLLSLNLRLYNCLDYLDAVMFLPLTSTVDTVTTVVIKMVLHRKWGFQNQMKIGIAVSGIGIMLVTE
jgi:hypothetical protein